MSYFTNFDGTIYAANLDHTLYLDRMIKAVDLSNGRYQQTPEQYLATCIEAIPCLPQKNKLPTELLFRIAFAMAMGAFDSDWLGFKESRYKMIFMLRTVYYEHGFGWDCQMKRAD